ncbi:porin [Vibrio sonorensis]|uniref:porin n=1 Tax=Vibrio sonorensis TaxID=1004316 RepID=UPI0008DB32CD|nr:porin [Vibrio sonorensis]
MNKTLIALAIAGAVTATGATAAEVYNQDGNSLEIGGRAEARMSLQDGKADDKSRVRLNIKGITQLTDSLYGVGFYEGEFTTADNDPAKDDDIEHRYTYAGIGGNFGEITYGKNDGALGVITDFTDIMAYHGNNAAYKIDVADRIDNTLAYKGQFSDLSLKASYRFANRVEKTDGSGYTDDKTDGYSLSAIYAIGDTGFKLGAGYADQDSGETGGVKKSSDQFMLAASYSINDLYFAGTYVDGQDKDGYTKTDKQGYELAAAYNMGQTVFSTTYNYLEGKTAGAKEDLQDKLAVDATYYFKPNFRGYVSYNFNLLSAGDNNGQVSKADAEDEIALGLRYDF